MAEAFEFPGDAARLGERVVSTICEPYDIDSRSMEVGISVGVAATRPDESAHDLRVRVDRLCYEVKSRGGGWRIDPADTDGIL